MSGPVIRNGVARLTVGAFQPDEAIDKARAYLERRGYITSRVIILDTHVPKVGMIGYRAFRIIADVTR